MARGPEGKIQDKVLRYAKSKGVLYKKNEVGRFFVASGWPDVNLYPGEGQVIFMEFKAPGGKLTPLQAHVSETLISKRYPYFVVDDVEDGKRIIDRFGTFGGNRGKTGLRT